MVANMSAPRYRDEALVSLNPVSSEDSPSSTLGRRFLLTAQNPTVHIGRSSKRNIETRPQSDNAYFESAVMSRHHAELVLDTASSSIQIRDSGSCHGTFVNESAILNQEPKTLISGDIIRFGVTIERGTDSFAPCVMEVSCRFGTTARNERPVVFRVPDDSDLEDISADEDIHLQRGSQLLKDNNIRISTHPAVMIDLTEPLRVEPSGDPAVDHAKEVASTSVLGFDMLPGIPSDNDTTRGVDGRESIDDISYDLDSSEDSVGESSLAETPSRKERSSSQSVPEHLSPSVNFSDVSIAAATASFSPLSPSCLNQDDHTGELPDCQGKNFPLHSIPYSPTKCLSTVHPQGNDRVEPWSAYDTTFPPMATQEPSAVTGMECMTDADPTPTTRDRVLADAPVVPGTAPVAPQPQQGHEPLPSIAHFFQQHGMRLPPILNEDPTDSFAVNAQDSEKPPEQSESDFPDRVAHPDIWRHTGPWAENDALPVASDKETGAETPLEESPVVSQTVVETHRDQNQPAIPKPVGTTSCNASFRKQPHEGARKRKASEISRGPYRAKAHSSSLLEEHSTSAAKSAPPVASSVADPNADVTPGVLPASQPPRKRLRWMARAIGYAALGGAATMSALIATAPSL